MTRRTLTGAAVAAIAATALLVGGALRMSGEETSSTPTNQLVRAGLEEQSLARRTGEPTHYTRSERALRQALAQDPNDIRALIGLASLANTRHHFREGLALARRVRSLAPDMALAYGVMGDALVELGRFEAGYRAYERMAELKPSIAAYARVAQAQAGLGEATRPGARSTSPSTPPWMRRPGSCERISSSPSSTSTTASGSASRSSVPAGARKARPSIEADDVLAWALVRNGRCAEARRYSPPCFAAGHVSTRRKFFHRGMIERCLDRPAEARRWFRRALRTNPHFSLRWAPVARRLSR